MKIVWFVLKSIVDYSDGGTDWIHEARITLTEPKDEDSDDFVDNYSITSVPRDSRVVHVVYHFHDNYCDHASFYTDRLTAENFFWEKVKEQHISMKEWNQHGWETICALQLDDKQDKIMSTLYSKEGCTISYPDKGNRWVLLTIDVVNK